MRLGGLDERCERRRVVDGEVREDLAVGLDAGRLEPLDEPVVGHVVRARAGVDPLDPQLAEVALLRLAVPVAVDQRVGDLLLGLAVQPRALSAVAGGALEGYPALLVGVDRPLDACHFLLLDAEELQGVELALLGQRPRSLRTFLLSALETSVVPLFRRVILYALRSRLCRSPAFWRRILPVPVTRKRLVAPECVFIFGMSCPSCWCGLARVATRLSVSHRAHMSGSRFSDRRRGFLSDGAVG